MLVARSPEVVLILSSSGIAVIQFVNKIFLKQIYAKVYTTRKQQS